MSSSFPEQPYPGRTVSLLSALLGIAALSAGTAHAADTYVQPQVELRVEDNSNFNLVPGGSDESNVYGYIADAQALIGIATPRSDTSIRPRARFQEYPEREDLERVELFFDIRSLYEGERSRFLAFGRYSRQDSHNAETPGAEFDPLDPNNPTNPDSATIVFGETRTRVQVKPEYSYRLTERSEFGVDADFQTVEYDADTGSVQTNTDYDFYAGGGFVRWALDPRNDFVVGAYANKYEAKDDSTETDAFGGRVGYHHRWSDVTGIQVDVLYEQNDTDDFIPVFTEESTSGWGGTVTAYRKGEVSDWRFSVGRTFVPTGSSGKSESDQARLQYNRDLTPRLSLTGAGRYESRNSLSISGQGNDRDYARVDFSLRWMVTSTWFLRGGYSYIWEDRQTAVSDADNNQFFVSFGYRGLDRRRR